ncbi:hypothetical protein IQ07DRAFT_101273 [Pyrenochaeta sp. DS3sAY3a]|nr:hypothetical protein IQ07DRAFT_101273 [Pyrenochaeta sp. DS3sAY3a]
MRYENDIVILVVCFVLGRTMWCLFMAAVLVSTSVGEEQLTRFLSRRIILPVSRLISHTHIHSSLTVFVLYPIHCSSPFPGHTPLLVIYFPLSYKLSQSYTYVPWLYISLSHAASVVMHLP